MPKCQKYFGASKAPAAQIDNASALGLHDGSVAQQWHGHAHLRDEEISVIDKMWRAELIRKPWLVLLIFERIRRPIMPKMGVLSKMNCSDGLLTTV